MFSAVPAAIRCQGLRKTYGSSDAATQALRGVDASIAAGELTILAGPSGCGKSTLLSIIAGLMDYDAGTCEVLGQEWKSLPTEQRESVRSRQLGFVFQAFNLLPALTALENVSVPLLIQGVTRRDAEARAQAALAGVGLAARARALPSALSGGQQQRVAIARALVHRPALLICDEPTSALDHSTGQEVMRLLRSAAVAPDRAVLVVTHDPRVHSFADRLLTMEDGRIVSDSVTPAQARE